MTVFVRSWAVPVRGAATARELCKQGRRALAELYRQDLRPAFRCDLLLLACLLLYSLMWLPLIARSTANPQLLASFNNDEPAISQQLTGMMKKPYGNPANLLKHPERRPNYWGAIAYAGIPYYGGTYLNAAFFLYAPLNIMGLPEFPTAPIVLRFVVYLSGLLSLVVLYNLGKRIGDSWVGAGAALLLMFDGYFITYSAEIHPDVTMLGLSLLALWMAVRHVDTGTKRTLVALAVLTGLVHGTKSGGFWLMPLAVGALAWSAWRGSLFAESCRAGGGRLLVRLGLFLGIAVAAFVVSTPYALVDAYYFARLRDLWEFNRNSPYCAYRWPDWVQGLYEYVGPVRSLLWLGALALLPLRCWRRDKPVSLVLAGVLSVSVFVWYSATVRLWVQPGYALTGLALVFLMTAELVCRPLLWLKRHGEVGQGLAVIAGAACVWLCLKEPFLNAANQVAFEHCRDHWTSIVAGRWGESHLPHSSKILFDDRAYFDPVTFPNAVMLGSTLKYADLEAQKPDYFLLSGSIYRSPNVRKMMDTEHDVRGKEGPRSILLYQDLIDRGSSPDAELVATFENNFPDCGSGWSWSSLLSYCRLALGLDDYLIGWEIKLYRYRPSPTLPPSSSGPSPAVVH
jgi:4-amino-4-deoxy-L-arabinose transferase-like glycosyltransferase